jgi:hypothetical protein
MMVILSQRERSKRLRWELKFGNHILLIVQLFITSLDSMLEETTYGHRY